MTLRYLQLVLVVICDKERRTQMNQENTQAFDTQLPNSEGDSVPEIQEVNEDLKKAVIENKADLSSFKGAKILVKTVKNGLDFSFEND